MRILVERCKQVAKSSSSVMIYGETGTGKELFAQSIHNASSRAEGPFLAINCAAIPEICLKACFLGRKKEPIRGLNPILVYLNRQTAEPCSLTRSIP